MIAERIRSLIENSTFTISVEPWKIGCTVSIGIATLNDEGSIEELISKADNFLYKSKQNGRNLVTAS